MPPSGGSRSLAYWLEENQRAEPEFVARREANGESQEARTEPKSRAGVVVGRQANGQRQELGIRGSGRQGLGLEQNKQEVEQSLHRKQEESLVQQRV